ncbi:hypothetical protein NGM33_28535 [Nocardiopsis dassonvillei]|uniref:hypothetical protein n=1 Tax=Nocardiopsis dassonvillei TaxID=2014 RepID=UPI0020A4947B|nr:hypothetical protein [Nocardiopsis dassonvillei]MCP3017284.1 hypothetical protein [Nocardiopsis dassonvillei]
MSTHKAAYDAVYAYITQLGDQLPPDAVHRNAMIWRAVEAALNAENSEEDR